MKNRLCDLNNHLFAQMERLSDEDLPAEELEREVRRARAIVGVSDQIIETASLQFRAAELVAEYGPDVRGMLPESMSGRLIEHSKDEKPAATAEERAVAARRAERERQEESEEWRRMNGKVLRQ